MPYRSPQHRAPYQLTKAQADQARKLAIDARRPTSTARGYDSEWRKLRAVFLKTHPDCMAPGCRAPATDVDHVVSIRARPDLRLEWGNLRALCHRCHSARTARDQGFARKG